jgi:hypothetical protein
MRDSFWMIYLLYHYRLAVLHTGVTCVGRGPREESLGLDGLF